MFFIHLLGLAFGAFIIALSGALMPGPLLTVTVSETLKRGKWTGPLLIVGHGVLELSLILLILGGLDYLFKMNKVIGGISLIGGVLLLWMGWDTIKKAKCLRLPYPLEKEAGTSRYGPILTGILASVSNPYWFIWWATIGIGYMAASLVYGWIGMTAFFVGHITADFLWYTVVSFSLAKGKRFISPKVYHQVTIVCGGLLCLFGLIFFYFGLKRMGL